MALVVIKNVSVLSNPATFFDPFRFEITFEVLEELKDDVEFKLVYVGSADDEAYDQALETLAVGPVPVGVSKFVFEADPPNAELLPQEDIVGVTVILLSCCYVEREFVRIGYYVRYDYTDETLKENPPEKVKLELLERSILDSKPRVTKFSIPWDGIGSVMTGADEGDVIHDDERTVQSKPDDVTVAEDREMEEATEVSAVGVMEKHDASSTTYEITTQ
ncbi:hypothetical protein SeMB42_g06703 [Synchytrium endobioticum]|uniref:Anti-silencing function protein 1 n=1 Tax=Synchytrium endobioticum TaxID=286115 RepID=A0A507CN94_9FUNG|nr:hypothetical protein SeMB42_g06703 [Synchytrium endobioticum]TPX40608.1 hypothetical protein SeLEV6574_g06529 [Synchytrium endobioticum]